MAFIQGTSAASAPNVNLSSAGIAFTSPNTKGNCIVVGIQWKAIAGSTGSLSVTDSAGNTYVELSGLPVYNMAHNAYIDVWVALNVANAPSNTVTFSYVPSTGAATAFADYAVAIREDQGVAKFSAVDQGAAIWGHFPTLTTPTAGFTTTNNSDLLIAFGGAPTFTPINLYPPSTGVGWNLRTSAGVTGSGDSIACYDLSQGAAGAVGITISAGVSIGAVAIVALRMGGAPNITGAWLVINEPASVNPTNPGFTDRSAWLATKGKTKHKFTNTLQQRGTTTIPLDLRAGNAYDATKIEGCQVFLSDITPAGRTLSWAGTIDKVNLQSKGMSGHRTATLSCVSLRQSFDKLRVPPQLFQYQTGGAIFTALFNSVAGGVSLALGDVIGAGSGPTGTGANFVINTLDLASSPWQRLSEVFDQIAQACACIWDIDLPSFTVYLKPPSTTPAPYAITPQQLLYDSVTWESNRADYRNWQSIQVSADAFGQSNELFAASLPNGGVPLSFTLKRPAKSVTSAWLTNSTQNSATGTFTGQPADGDTFTITYPQSGSIYNWAPNAPYAAGQIIIDPLNHVQIVKTAGTSGASQAAINSGAGWNDTGGTSSDGPGSPTLPGFSGAVIWQDQGISEPGGVSAFIYTAKNVLDNTVWGQFLIDPSGNYSQTNQNFADAINGNTAVQGGISGSPTYSAPTWESPLVNAGTVSGPTITIFNKTAGAGYKAALSTTSAAFSWSAAQTGGGSTGDTYSLQIAANGSSNTANLYFTPGSSVVALASDPTTHHTGFLQVSYQAAGSDFIIVENSAEILLRAAIENGDGLYMQSISQTSITSAAEALQFVQQILDAYDSVPLSFSFTVYGPGLLPGQLLTISITAPSYLAALINGAWFIQEVSAELVNVRPAPWMNQSSAPGGGHYRYTVTVINESQIQSWLAFWEKLASGGSGGGGAGLVAGSSPGSGSGVIGSLPSGVFNMGTTGNLTPNGTAYIQSTGTGATQGALTGAAHIEPPTVANVGISFKLQIIQPASGSGFGVTFDAIYKGLGTFGLDSSIGTQAVLEFLIMSATEIQLMNVAQNGYPTT